MPKLPSWHWEHFFGGEKQNQVFKRAFCNYCIEAKVKELRQSDEFQVIDGSLLAVREQSMLVLDARGKIQSTMGRIDVLNNHLCKCVHVPPSVQSRAVARKALQLPPIIDLDSEAGNIDSEALTTKKHSRSESQSMDKLLKRQKAFQVVAAKSIPFSENMQTEFEDQLLKAFVSSGTAFNRIEDPEFQRLFTKFVPGALVPTRQRLESKILCRAIVKMEGEVKALVKGSFVTLSCDGWKDVSRKHLVAFMITTNRETHALHVFDVSSKRKTAANLLPLMEKECKYVKEELGGVVLGICGDAAGDEHKSRMDLVAKCPWYLAVDCWAHQISLILGDFVKRNPNIGTLMDEVVEVIKWFINHSFALGLFNDEQQAMNKKKLALVIPIATRWTAYFLSLDRLLSVWKPLQITAIKHETQLLGSVGPKATTKEKARNVLSRVRDDSWWRQISRIKAQIEPLAIAVNVAQDGNVRCDQILLLLGKLYKTYIEACISQRVTAEDSSTDESHELSSILDSIEKRWAKTDQDLHIAAFFLNPYLNTKLLNQNEMSAAVLMGILRRLYKRLFRNESETPSDLMDSIYKYHTRTGLFSPDCWPIEELEIGLRGVDGTCDPVKVWRLLDLSNSLVSLAIRVLSFCPNSASAERLFSTMGNIKDKKRNRMLTQKLRDLAFLQLELRHTHAKKGLVRQRLKRSFGNIETKSSLAKMDQAVVGSPEDMAVVEEMEDLLAHQSDNEDEPDVETAGAVSSFASLLEKGHYESDENEDNSHGTVVDQESSRPSMPQTVRVFFGLKRHIPIERIFNWNEESGWDKYWFNGVKNCRQELDFYELILQAEDREEGEGDSSGTAVDELLPQLHATSSAIVIDDT